MFKRIMMVTAALSFCLSVSARSMDASKRFPTTSSKSKFSSLFVPLYPIQQNSMKGTVPQSVIDHIDPEVLSDPSFTPRGRCRTALRTAASLEEALLGDCRWVAEQMIWQTGEGGITSYSEWSEQKKSRLQDLYNRILRNDVDLGIQCPSYEAASSPLRDTSVYITAQQAFDIYATHIAWFLTTEVNGSIPWSLYQFSREELKELLQSDHYFALIASSGVGGYPSGITPHHDYQLLPQKRNHPSISCDPRVAYHFLLGTNSTDPGMRSLIAMTPQDTLVLLTQFFHNHVAHNQPIELTRSLRSNYFTLKDRLRSHPVTEGVVPGSTEEALIAYVGCWSSTNLFYDLAKSIKIPLKVINSFEGPVNIEGESPEYPFPGTPADPLDNPGMHLGLLYQWTNPAEARILIHTDHIYADFNPMLPINGGRALTPFSAEAGSLLFEKTWLHLEDARKIGFHYLSSLPAIHNLGGYDSTNSDRLFYGYAGGYWEKGCSSDRYRSCLFYIRQQELNYDLCGWDRNFQNYCEDPTTFYNTLSSTHYLPTRPDIPGIDLSLFHTARQREARVGVCVRSYGGCPYITGTLLPMWSAQRGADSWRD
ncbi:MAG: hypothetical protein IPJ69_06015 [Deltaproteobacteria bacterium]|nr:MAG: hypothetical protein IPJ69_06015 [Deltaproteobacteria bacterium]